MDDAVVMRRLIGGVIEEDPELELAGVAANGRLALAKIPQVNPDIVTLDVEMPEMDGLETVTEIRKIYRSLPIIMFSTLTERGAEKTLEALKRGATDYVTKPANVGNVSTSIERLREELIPKIKAHCHTIVSRFAAPQQAAALPAPRVPVTPSRALTRPAGFHCRVIAIGTSTGGPNALHQVIPALPPSLPVPVVIVQHMPPLFTAMLAQRLDECSRIRVHEASEGQRIEPGHVYIAPGGKHLEIASSGTGPVARLHEGPPENSCRPAVDVLFRSVASVYGAGSLGVVLTGMGQDGLRGSQVLQEAGGRILAQDQASSVVWGMPGAVVSAGVADQVIDINHMAQAIIALQ